MEFENIIVTTQNRIQYITINRESKLNALNKFTICELHEAFVDAFNNPDVGGIILTGAGPKAFVAGADISEFADLSLEEGTALARENQKLVFDLIANGSKPVIAAINGFALGGGLELAMACHIRIASDNAKMGLPEVTLGLIPGYGGTQRLTQLVGKGKAMEMILTADMITAEDALQYGLVTHVTATEELLAKAEELMIKIISRAPLALAAAIRSVNAGLTDGVNGYETEIAEFGKCFGTDDFKEGVAAFLGKRKAEFKGK
ncbi:enoyl-CoA hydratase/isomerase family protein [Mucilaginibacter flavus]|uniref:enoyl-CoA hydratase/isomerase family protein n=1 Tax=Mucilaginibacter flavus TaxID=931504 RepID=UPI0025B40828|nr:enoyl-CoA hydratase-related protein [Mucilaginibacter flavus]MDN3579309.1 enoyl-CoA hydratase-related protein [Mucilaginibacter flavus]